MRIHRDTHIVRLGITRRRRHRVSEGIRAVKVFVRRVFHLAVDYLNRARCRRTHTRHARIRTKAVVSQDVDRHRRVFIRDRRIRNNVNNRINSHRDCRRISTAIPIINDVGDGIRTIEVGVGCVVQRAIVVDRDLAIGG